MTQSKLPFVFSKMKAPRKFKSPRQSFSKKPLPPRDAKEHRRYLLEQLNAVQKKIDSPSTEKLAEAKGTIVAVKRAKNSDISVDSLGDKRSGVRVLYDIPEERTTILDVSEGDLSALKRKIQAYGEKPKLSARSKSKVPKPAHNALVAPIESIVQIDKKLFSLVWGPKLTKLSKEVPKDEDLWLEISLRGGRYVDANETELSRRLFAEAVEELELGEQDFPEFMAAERLVFLCFCTIEQSRQIFEMTGAVIEVELATSVTLNWELIEHPEKFPPELPQFQKPAKDAPSVVVLDTGINKAHPFLQDAVFFAGSVHHEDTSHDDNNGHGTNMAGVALYDETLASVARAGQTYKLSHWLESIKLFTGKQSKSASRANAPFWPNMTKDAINLSDSKGRKTEKKAFVIAVTAPNVEPGSATSWSLALDELAFNEGLGRLFFVSIGNSEGDTYDKIIKNYPQELMLSKLKDPSQSFNSMTVGAFTGKDALPTNGSYKDYKPVANKGAVSPHTSSGVPFNSAYKVPIKPEIVFEGGNLAVDRTTFPDDKVPTLTTVTTGRDHNRSPFEMTFGTSPATALAGCLAMRIWNENPKLWPETVRGLMIHSASWTDEMLKLLPGRDDRISLCGYGVPSPEVAMFCTKDRATIVIEDSLANLQKIGTQTERQMKTFSLPVPSAILLANPDAEVELRVTLSYFAEPNSAKGVPTRGMDLLWDIQGPTEEDEEFLKRINDDMRAEEEGPPGTKSFKNWEIGILKRRRGTIQGDRWVGPAASLAGAKLIAVYPKNGWWNARKEMKFQSTRFSLIISVITPGIEIYNEIKSAIEIETEVEIDL